MIRENPFVSGVDIPREKFSEIWEYIIQTGNRILEGTAFVTGDSFTESDLDKLKDLYQKVLDFEAEKLGENGAVFNTSLREHLGMAEQIAVPIAEALHLDPFLLRALMLTHDLGRFISHRRGRNDLIGEALEKRLDLHENFTSLLPSDSLWLETDTAKVHETLLEMTTKDGGITAAIDLIDVFAKWSDHSKVRLRRWDQIIPKTSANQNAPIESKMYPSEFARQKIMAENQDNLKYIYTYFKNWFEATTGRKIDDIISEAEAVVLSNPLSSNWRD